MHGPADAPRQSAKNVTRRVGKETTENCMTSELIRMFVAYFRSEIYRG